MTEDLAAAALTLARRFAAGATMWTLAPQWPAHGRHVAVEFVHPVIVGKRALPAIHVDDPDPTARLRALHRPGDVVLAIGAGPGVDEVMRRTEAWGVTGIWIGDGPRPAAGAADHVLWLDDSGDFVLLYHLLWELTHVVFEHPGLLEAAEPDTAGDVCITCSDEGRPAEVTRPLDDTTAEVLAAGRVETIDVTLVGPVAAGDLVLVHAGSAITLLPELPDQPEVDEEPTGFLYPFLDATERDSGSLLTDLAASARGKTAESHRLQSATLTAHADRLHDVAADLAARFRAGARLFTFGNGGSATDAETAAALFHPLPALSLVADRAVVTALANDVGFELVFSRQLIAHARDGDIAMGFSTSGGSPNILRAFTEAHRLGLVTIGFAGYDGGPMAKSPDLDHCFVVASDSVHRIQEAQATLLHHLRSLVR